MVEIAISVAAKVAEYFVAPIVRPFSYIWNYKTNFQNLESEVGKLKGKQDEVQHLVDDARRNGEDIEQRVNVWLDSVKKKVDEVSSEIIQEKNEQANMNCFNGLCPNPKKLYQHSRNAVRKAKSIVELRQEGNFEQVSHRAIPKEIWISSYKGYEAFESRKSTLEKILNALSNPDVNMLSICGVGGIGKTTLARAVAEHAENNKLFDVVAFAEVSAVPDIRKIQGEIADMLGLTFHVESIPGRASKLHEYLKQQKKKILLVLDNIWATLELDKVGIPFGDDCKVCKVLLTARDLDALTLTGSQLNFSMDVLNDQETWNLFSTTSGDCIEQSDLQVLAKEVAKACGGLPIAIVTIAKALRNKKEFEWRNALQELKKPSPRTLEGVAGEAYSCIEFSYNQLKDEELKSIFLHCSAMGSTNNASIGDLVKYGMGLRIFKGINIIKEARDRVDTLVRKLKDASLLLDTPNNGSFSMHDVVRDVGRLIASRNQQVVIGMDDNVRRDWDDDDTLKTSTRIFLHKIRELPKELECQHVEFLYMQTEEDTLAIIPDNFFTKTSKLRVLHLVGFDLSSLPTSLCLLVNLCTMCINKCKVQDIGLIGELKKLEILSIDDYYIERLPKEVCKLTGLRLLDLSTCYSLREIPPNIIASLTQLEELYLNNYISWEVQGGSNASLDELKCLPHLTVLEITIRNTNVLSKGLFSKNLEMYNIKIGQRSKKYQFIEKWPKATRKLEKLELNLRDNCSCLEDVLHKTPSVKNVLYALDGGEGFPKLKQLWVHHSSCFHTVADCSESESYNPFASLETLFLEALNNLEKIYNGQFGAEFLCQLRNIKVERCDDLKNIFSFSTIRALPLEEIEVCDCVNITEIFAIGNEEDMIHLKELRSMTLECLPKLTSFCSINNNGVILEDTPTATFNGKVGFPNLKTLKLGDINSEQIWYNQLPAIPFCFQSLRELNVWSCHKLKFLFSSPTVVFPSLEIIEISHMDDLEMIWHNQLAEDSFRSLKSVKVIECNKLLTIFKFNMLERFTRLESLSVRSCNSLEEIFDLQEVNLEKWSHFTVSSQLRELELWDLQKLRHIWIKVPQGKHSFQKLNKVMIYDCRSLENIFPASIAKNLSQLERLNIFGCVAMEKIVAEEEGADLEAVTRFDFPRLTSLGLTGVSQLRYFYPGRHTAEWPELKELRISDCDKIGLLASEGQLNIPAQQQPLFFFVEKVAFPSLEMIEISDMNDLELIWHNQLADDSFRSLKSVKVKECNKLLTIFKFNMLERFTRLESLSVQRCNSLEEIFDLQEVNLERWSHSTVSSQLRELDLQDLPKMRHIWNKDPQRKLSFQKLNEVTIGNCRSLENIFPDSIAKNLSQLERLDIFGCGTMEKIVAEEEGADLEAVTRFDFPRLTTLKLRGLSQLRYFYPGRHTAEWPALSKLSISDCDKIGLLASEENNEEGQLNIPAQQQPLFFVKKGCFLKLEKLHLTGGSLRLISQAQFSEHLIPKLKFLRVDYGESVFPPDILWRFPNLEKLEFYEGSYEEIFSLEEIEKHSERPAQIKSLKLQGFEKMKCIWKQHSKLDLIIQKLEILDVESCGLTDLLPPSAIFRNLKILHVKYCYKLTSILTSSTAESLVQLTEMKIERCNLLTEVVATDEGDVTKNKIIFHRLKTLTLSWLSSLTNFCIENYTFEFPALEKLELFDCNKMEIFCPGVLSTPNLNKVYCNWRNTPDWILEGDLNTTIQEMYRKRHKRTNADYCEEGMIPLEERFSMAWRKNTEGSEEDGVGPSTQHQVLQNTEGSEEDGAGPSTQHQVLQNTEGSEADGSGPSTQHQVLQNTEGSEEDGSSPSTQHQVLQNTENSEEDGSGLSTQHLVLQNAKSYEEDGAGPSTQHLE